MKENNRVLSLLLCIVMAFGMLSAFCLPAQADIPSISLDEEKYIEILTEGDAVQYSFTAPESGYYRFYSYDYDSDPRISIYAENWEDYDDDSGEGWNFNINRYLDEGETVTVEYYSHSTDAFFTKIEKSVFASSVEIDGGDSFTGYVGFGSWFSCTLLPEGCMNEDVTWTSLDDDILEFDGDYASYKSAGTVTITATTENGLTDTATVTVKEPDVIALGDTVYLDEGCYAYYKFVPTEDGVYSYDTWSGYWDIYDSNYEYFDDLHQMELEAGNTYYIYFYSYSDDNAFTLKKLQPATSVSIDGGDSITGYIGFNKWFYCIFSPEGCIQESAEWTSSDNDILEFDDYNDNCAHLKSAGTVTITATTENGLTDTATVTVKEPEVIALGDTVYLDEDCYAYYKFIPTEDGVYSYEAWSSNWSVYDSNYEYIYSDNYYQKELLAGNTYYIYFYSYSDDNAFTLKKLQPATSVSIDGGDSITGYIGFNKWFYCIFSPEGCIQESAEWTSSDDDVLEFDGSYANYKSAGTVTVTATTENGLTDTATVTVKEPEVIALGDTVYLDRGCHAYYKFVPTEDGVYSYEAWSSDWSVYDSNYEYIYSDNYYQKELLADNTYYIYFYSYSDDNAFTLKKLQPATSVSIDGGDSITGYIGFNKWFYCIFSPEGCIQESAEWTSSDDDVLEFDGSYANYKSAGTVTVTATTESGLTDTATVTVKEPEVIALGDTVYLDRGCHAYYKFVPTEDGMYSYNMWSGYWDIYDSNYEYFGDLHQMELEAGNTYYIRFYSWSDNGSFSLRKLQPATSVSIDGGDSFTGYIGFDEWFYCTLSPEDCIDEDVTWISSDNDILEFDDYYGNCAYLKSAGTVTITATTENGLTDTATVTVKEPAVIAVGDTVYLDEDCEAYYKFVPTEDGVYSYDTWSGNWDIYDINYEFVEDLYQMELEAGKTYYIRFNSWSDNNPFTLKKLQPATSVSIDDGDSFTGFVGFNKWFYCTLSPEDCIGEDVTWTSSDNDVLEFDGNRANYKAAGTVTVTATTESGLTDTATVTVKAPVDLTLNTKAEGEFTDDSVMYKFTASESGYYRFYISGDSIRTIIYSADGYWRLEDNWYYGEECEAYAAYFEEGETVYAELYSNANITYGITVKEAIAPTSIEIDMDKKSIGQYYYFEPECEFLPEGSVEEYVNYSSDDESVLEVYASGTLYVYSKTPGTATLHASSESGLEADAEIKVTEATSLTLGEPKHVEHGEMDGDYEYYSDSFVIIPDHDGEYTFTVESEKEMVINRGRWEYSYGNFNFTGRENQPVYFNVLNLDGGDWDYTATLTEQVQASGIKFKYDSIPDVFVDEYIWLEYELEPSYGYCNNITFTSSNEDVATVYGDGIIETFSTGTAVITATLPNGASDSIEITVVDNSIELGTTHTISKALSDYGKMFTFTPEESGTYVFKSLATEDTDCTVESDDGYIDESTDSDPFLLEVELEAGVEYYVYIEYYGETASEHSFVVTKKGECAHINKESHDAKPSTCKVNGHAAYVYCNDCDKVISGSNALLPLDSHKYDNACDTSCNVCGGTRTITHAFGAYVSDKNATTEKDGTKTRVCSVCGAKDTVTDVGSKLPTSKPEEKPVEIKDTTKIFTDVKAKKWYTNAVNYAYSHGFIAGVSDNEFGRDVPVTRGMFITILARIAGVDTSSKANKVTTKFTDVKSGKYYTNAIKWASENGVVNGLTDTTFGPNASIERQQLCTMIVNFAKYMEIELPETQKEIKFKDEASIRKYAKKAVASCQKAGVVSGYAVDGGTEFKPLNTATRAEAAQILYKFHKDFVAK